METTIKRTNGELVLVLPGKDGTMHEITLQAGKVEAILHTLLAQQAITPTVAKVAGPSWKFLLESGLLAGKVTKVPQGVSGTHLKLEAKKNAEDLGL